MNKVQFDRQKIIDHWVAGSDDDYKRSFQKKCTLAFTLDWVNKIKKIRLWIKEQIK